MVRKAAFAGSFYPDDPGRLRRAIVAGLPVPGEEPTQAARAVLAPHAGYIYSGNVAGAVFSSVTLPGRFILLGPNHTGRGAGMALAPAEEWVTPLGKTPVDEGMNHALLEACPSLREDASAHRDEHAIEVQIPFLQVLAPGFRFSAVCIRTLDYALLEELGHALGQVIWRMTEPVLLVSSSDMTHYETAASAARRDRLAIERILALDPAGLYETVMEEGISMCGIGPTVAVLVACRDLGARAGRLVRYTHSGEVTGDHERVVAYAGIVIA
ncbi:MAG: AmmeMemoRadiSam system protein B [Acidobacteria bacterium]|jgi:AmmeMemoRadiSam system protein B|nr:AmmeMemoRadiSam system protein B [Acidobacteriota bacterium]